MNDCLFVISFLITEAKPFFFKYGSTLCEWLKMLLEVTSYLKPQYQSELLPYGCQEYSWGTPNNADDSAAVGYLPN